MIKKLNIMCHESWSHHHSGWPYCVCGFINQIHNPNGVDTYTNSVVPLIMKSNRIFQNYWVGFLHITCSEFYNLEKYINSYYFKKNAEKCLGFFFMSEHVCKFYENKLGVRCESVKQAIAKPKYNFNIKKAFLNKKIATVGHWLRNIDAISKIQTNCFEKIILSCTNENYNYEKVNVIRYLDDENYEKFLSETIIFLNLLDSSVNNVVLECIVRSTPLVVNRLPAIEEYLGKNYPLFYDSIDQVQSLINYENIILANSYLNNMDKSFLNLDSMIKNIVESDIYKAIDKDFLR